MTSTRAASGLLLIAIALLIGPTPVPARAQAPSGRLVLVSETPWNTPKDPVLQVSVRAVNTGNGPVGDLSIGITIGAPVRSRSLFEASLTQGPGLALYARTKEEPGTLAPGASQRFDLAVNLTAPGVGVSTVESLVYPMRVDVRSGGVPVAFVDTPAIFLIQKPEEPLLVSWNLELSAPIALGPDGRLADPSFERAIAPHGWISSEVAALRRVAGGPGASPFDLVVDPGTLEQLSRMADGYERIDGTVVRAHTGTAANAATILDSLSAVARSDAAEVVALPFAAPNIPAMLASGLAKDFRAQVSLGRTTVVDLLGVSPSATVQRAPAGAIDDDTVAALTSLGATTVLADAGTVPRPPQPNEFAPLPTATLAAGLGASPTTANLVLPDPSAEALLAGSGFLDDPVRAAQATLGELATIWREIPVPASPRGVALQLPPGLPAGFWGPFLGRLAEAPFIRSIHPEDLVKQIPAPSGPPSTLAAPTVAAFSPEYVDAIKGERRNIGAFASMLTQPSPVPGRLERDLLYAEAGQYVSAEGEGRAWVDQANRVTESTFARAEPDTKQVFTFTSRTGSIPLVMGDPGATPIRISVQLRSAQFRFPDGDTRTVTLSTPNQIVTFGVVAKTTGQSTILVVVRAPSGRPIRQATLYVRSTAVNAIALVVTIGAALVLVGLWSRRLFRRTTTA